jgi:hypothetical protein
MKWQSCLSFKKVFHYKHNKTATSFSPLSFINQQVAAQEAANQTLIVFVECFSLQLISK